MFTYKGASGGGGYAEQINHGRRGSAADGSWWSSLSISVYLHEVFEVFYSSWLMTLPCLI